MKNNYKIIPLVGVTLLAMCVSACNNSSSVTAAESTQSGNSANSGIAPKTRYDMANGCYALQSNAKNAYAVHAPDGGYTANAALLSAAEALYMKPTALGKYLIQSRDGTLLVGSGASVGSAAAPSDASNWVINTDAQGFFTLVLETLGKALAVDSAGKLILVDAGSAGESEQFRFVPSAGCTAYPEMPTGIHEASFKGAGIDKPVLGFADNHNHMAMASELSDGSGHVGGSAAEALYGQMFNRFGVLEALKNCIEFHGPNGATDVENVIIDRDPTKTHDTAGWPTFVDWPARDSQTHQQMYYKWVERAWKSGLRVMTVYGTNISSLCELARLGTGRPNVDCNDLSIGAKQIAYLQGLPDYVDAQEGGPGKGWARIVKTPAEARAVINDGKLAIVPGFEFANQFDCTLVFNPDGSEVHGCDKAKIDQEIDRAYALGVRQIVPFHDENTALGGFAIFIGDAQNLFSIYRTHQFLKTYTCPQVEYFNNKAAGSEMTSSIPVTGSDPISKALFAATSGLIPIYPAGRQCNARGLTELGRYAVQQLMKKKFIINVDHAELPVKQAIIDIAKAQTPVYPLISDHGGSITNQQAKDILNLGGVIYPFKPNGKGQANFVKTLKAITPANRLFAFGFGSDNNGAVDLAVPRGAGTVPVRYPFTLFQGPGWGPQFAAAGIKPLQVELLTVKESGKSWNVDEVGMAHYGMVADFVEETRIEGGEEAITALYNSAEAFLQMWERVVNR